MDKQNLADGQGWCDKHQLIYHIKDNSGCFLCTLENETMIFKKCRIALFTISPDAISYTETRINTWLTKHEDDIEIQDIKITSGNNINPLIMVVYNKK